MSILTLQREISLDQWLDPDETCTLNTFLAAPAPMAAEETLYQKEVTALVRAAVARLDQRELHIIRNRFGLLDGREATFEEIGRELNLSRERVRQIERSVKNKLRLRLNRHFATARRSAA